MYDEPTHRSIWKLSLLFFALFLALAIVHDPDLMRIAKGIALAASVTLFCIGWTARERELDEPVFNLILEERERRLEGGRGFRDAA